MKLLLRYQSFWLRNRWIEGCGVNIGLLYREVSQSKSRRVVGGVDKVRGVCVCERRRDGVKNAEEC